MLVERLLTATRQSSWEKAVATEDSRRDGDSGEEVDEEDLSEENPNTSEMNETFVGVCLLSLPTAAFIDIVDETPN